MLMVMRLFDLDSEEIMMQIPESANKGLENIIACTSEISTIADTTLLFRGYTIEDLSEHCSFEEVVYLLWNGKLPTRNELEHFQSSIRSHLTLSPSFLQVLKGIAATHAHSMSKLQTAVSYYGLNFTDADSVDLESIKKKGIQLTGALGSIVAALSRYEQGKEPMQADPSKSIAWNFLHSILGEAPSAEHEKLLDVSLILHADHELNASAFTVRVVASSLSDYFSAITAAIGSLKGSLHGGANEAVMLMLKGIGSYSKVDAFIDDAIQSKKKVMGIGHRVYKHGDPRAKIFRKLSGNLAKASGLEDEYKMLTRIEDRMLNEKGLMPNVDFYSGIIYTALKIRPRDFTPLFAVSRIAGWTAQCLEQYANNRIYRPRAFYTGPAQRDFVPVGSR